MGQALSKAVIDFAVEKPVIVKRKRNIKIKKLLPEPKQVEIRKNGRVIKRITVRSKSYFPGRRKRTY